MTNTPNTQTDMPEQESAPNNGIESRKVAYQILSEVLLRKTPLDQVLARHEGFNTIDGREKGFIRMLVATALRRKGQMDELIQKCLDKKQELKPQSLPVILYIGITQVLFMNVPYHAAVDTTVTLAGEENMEKQKGFINAVLRRMTAEGQGWREKQDIVNTNMPLWLLQKWIADYDLKTAGEIALGSLEEAAIDITLKDYSKIDEWEVALNATRLPTNSLRLTNAGNITDLKGFDAGQWWVQDASAALPAKMLGGLNGDKLKGKTVIDLCAAPGGKTAQLAAMGANVMAVDRSAKRLERLRENMKRLNLEDKVEVIAADGGVWQPATPVDAVLLDAPCTATGTIRRHPDVMHLKGEKDLEQLTDLQVRLLNNAANMVATGGILIYCTCSLQKAEGEKQIERFLNAHKDFSRNPIASDEVGGLNELITSDGDIRVMPNHMQQQGGMDGFYVARLIRG